SSTFEELSDIGSPGVIPSPDYIPGPEERQSPPPLDYVPEPIYPEYMPHEDEMFLAEEQPLPAAASPTAQSPDYVLKSDPEADPEEDDDEDPEEDPVDYPADGGDDDDDEEGSSEDDEDDDIDIEADDDEEEEEEHPAPADSVVVTLPATDQASSTEETESSSTYTSMVGCRGIALGPAYEVGVSSSAAAARPAGGLRTDYGFVATIDREIRHDPERDDTDEIYMRLDDEQSGRQLLVGQLNMLFRDRRAHARTARLMETEARMSREAWGLSVDLSDLARVDVMSLRTTVLAQQ
ncbi:hypothetical protein Tco_1535827, partial [Tanacetum coccineum]